MKKIGFDNKLVKPSLEFQPLYKQIEGYMKQLIVEQRFKPGEALPNEFQLAEEFGVSQGTVRKALNALTSTKILTRKQGVGTFVSKHSTQQSLYRFFPMIRDGAEPALPEANLLSLKVESVSPEILERLALKPNEAVIHLVRQRLLDGKVFMLESIYLPQKYFPGLEHETELPHTLYHYYQESFKLTVHKTQDSIKAVLSNEDDVSLLCDTMGQALLEVRRVTETIDDKIIEFRVSRCLSDNYHYLVDSN